MKIIAGLIISTLVLSAVTIPFQVNAATDATLETENGSIFVTVEGRKQILASMSPEQMKRLLQMGENALVETKDFNFDGNTDIAVSSGNIGYGGVNNYKNYYFYDPNTHRFTLAGKEINALQITGKSLISYTKDGPFTYQERYGIAESKLYKKSETLDVGFLTKTIRFNSEGEVLKTNFTPDTLTVTAPKAYFYTQPNEGSKTKVYVIKGDKVKVLDYKPFEGWLFIAYKSPKKVFKRWIRQKDVEER